MGIITFFCFSFAFQEWGINFANKKAYRIGQFFDIILATKTLSTLTHHVKLLVLLASLQLYCKNQFHFIKNVAGLSYISPKTGEEIIMVAGSEIVPSWSPMPLKIE